MGQIVLFPCCNDGPSPKPSHSPSHDTSLTPPTPITSLERLMLQPRTLPVIAEEEWVDSEPASARPVRQRRGKRMELKAMLVRKRLKLGYHGSTLKAPSLL